MSATHIPLQRPRRTTHTVTIESEGRAVGSAFGAVCSDCGELGGRYFTRGGAERIAQEHAEFIWQCAFRTAMKDTAKAAAIRAIVEGR